MSAADLEHDDNEDDGGGDDSDCYCFSGYELWLS